MNLLTSDDNFNLIKSVLQMSFKKKSIDINNRFDNDIKTVIQFIDSKINYIDETNIQSANKKVLDFSFNTISEKLIPKKIKPSPPPKNRASVDSIFDNQISSETNPSDFLPPPSLKQDNRESIDSLLQNHESQRNLLNPPKPSNTQLPPANSSINFSLDEPEIDQNKAYEDIVKQRGLGNMLDLKKNNTNKPVQNINEPVQHQNNINEVINDFNINGLTDDNMSTSINDITNSKIDNNESNIIKNVSPIITNNNQDQNLYNISNSVKPNHHLLVKQDKIHYITIDSKYRNLERYPNPSQFQLIFNSNNSYKNIKSIELIHCNIPNHNSPYFNLYINELNNNISIINSNTKSPFTKLVHCNDYNSNNTICNLKSITDKYIFDETSLGIIDKLTMQIKTFNNNYIVKNDIVYINSIEKINNNLKIYCNEHSLKNNDIIYIYNTKPLDSNCLSFDKDIIISLMDIIEYKNESNKELVKINAKYYNKTLNMEVDAQSILKNDTSELDEINYNFSNILDSETDYLYIKYKNVQNNEVYTEMLKIYNVLNEDLIIIKPENYHNDIGYEIQEFKYAKQNKRGYSLSDESSLFNLTGHSVFNVEKDNFCINGYYNNIINKDEIFFIHHNNQINYTFKIII